MHTTGADEARAVGTADLAVLYARYRDFVVAYLRGQGARDPEDLASEVFVAVVRALPGFRGDEHAFRSWLLVIAHRRLVDQRRVSTRRPTETVEPGRLVDLCDLVDRTRDAARDAETAVLDRLGAERVLTALARLTTDQRTVVLLHAVDDLSLPQIARLLGKRLAAVKSLHHRGLATAVRAMGTRDRWAHAEVA
jgi:RNA polymerase sigma-70 factor (ECF subfamily)